MLNKQEKEQVIKILKRTALNKNQEIIDLALKQSNEREKEINELSETRHKLQTFNNLKAKREQLNKEIKKSEEDLKKYAGKLNASFSDNRYCDDKKPCLDVSCNEIERTLSKKLNDKVEEMTLKILCADCDKKILELVSELKNFKL